jgi:hypothetical protein
MVGVTGFHQASGKTGGDVFADASVLLGGRTADGYAAQEQGDL